jgi:hypothetical protein
MGVVALTQVVDRRTQSNDYQLLNSSRATRLIYFRMGVTQGINNSCLMYTRRLGMWL